MEHAVHSPQSNSIERAEYCPRPPLALSALSIPLEQIFCRGKNRIPSINCPNLFNTIA
jgi:hypothetical protein